MTFLMNAHDTLARMDWLHASWLVNDVSAPLMAAFNLVLSAWVRVAEIPVIGAGLANEFWPVLNALFVVALSGALLVVLVLLGSALLSGAIEIVLGSGAQLLDGFAQLMRLVRGA